jgi:hypothetical protein
MLSAHSSGRASSLTAERPRLVGRSLSLEFFLFFFEIRAKLGNPIRRDYQKLTSIGSKHGKGRDFTGPFRPNASTPGGDRTKAQYA